MDDNERRKRMEMESKNRNAIHKNKKWGLGKARGMVSRKSDHVLSFAE